MYLPIKHVLKVPCHIKNVNKHLHTNLKSAMFWQVWFIQTCLKVLLSVKFDDGVPQGWAEHNGKTTLFHSAKETFKEGFHATKETCKGESKQNGKTSLFHARENKSKMEKQACSMQGRIKAKSL